MLNKEPVIRIMTMEDYDKLYDLWMSISGFGIRSVDDSREGVARFIKRNPTTSMVAYNGEELIGAILCGHDGRRACLYHVCVKENYRKNGIGQKLVRACLKALEKEEINKVNLIAFTQNEVGNRFWRGLGWDYREDVNYYECVLNKENKTTFNP